MNRYSKLHPCARAANQGLGMGEIHRKILLQVFIFSLAIFFTSLAKAETYFAGKMIEWVVPFKVGGGTDAWARYVAPFLAEHLPGNPEVKIRNLPGGGSTKAANQFAAKASPDGLSLLGCSASTQFSFLLGDPRVRYNYERWQVLMAERTGGVVYTTPVFGVMQAAQIPRLVNRHLVYGSQGATSLDLVPLLGFELLGLDVKPIFGIRGRSAGRLAFERGEATIDFQTTAAYIKHVQPLVDKGMAVPLFTLGVLNSQGQLVRDPVFPDLPHFAEVFETIHGKPPQGLAWESWYAFFSAGFAAQKLLVIPKDTPERIVQMYQGAIRSMLKNPGYISTKEHAIGSYEQVTGIEADRLYKLATDVPAAQKKWVRKWLRSKYDLSIQETQI